MEIHETSHRTFRKVIILALIAGVAVIVAFSLIARASGNLQAAFTDKPDIAVLLLLKEEGTAVTQSTLLRDLEQERDYLVHTKEEHFFVKIRKVEGRWRIVEQEQLRED